MGSITETSWAVADACRVCRDAPAREECYLTVEGQERPICRACWEQALVDLHRVARRLRTPVVPARFRLS